MPDYSEPIVQAGEDVAVAIKVLTVEVHEVRKTMDRVLSVLEALLKVQVNRR